MEQSRGAGQTAEDYYNVCYFAMRYGVEQYDPERGFKLISFMTFPLLNEFNLLLGRKTRRRNVLNDCLSLDVTAEDGETPYIEIIEDPESLTPFEEMSDKQDTLILRAELKAALDTLPEREADIIRTHFFKGVPVEQTAERYGISRKRGYEIERRGLDSLRECEEIARYHDDIISREAYHYTGFNAWKTSGVSSVERAVELAEKLINECLGVRNGE
jgi:RNA polymerase sigma factor (sigma-70 family)